MMNRPTKIATHAMMGLGLAVGVAVLPACDMGPRQVGEEITFAVQPSSERILAGETVTLTTQSSNVLGRDAEIQWHAQGGEVRTSQNGRVAQVTFRNPGTYNVTADLLVNNQRYTTQTTRIEVRPLPVEQTGAIEERRQGGDVQEGALQPSPHGALQGGQQGQQQYQQGQQQGQQQYGQPGQPQQGNFQDDRMD